jgi:hypothetical protein
VTHRGGRGRREAGLSASRLIGEILLQRAIKIADTGSQGEAMKPVLIIATWQSEHLVEIEGEENLENLAEVLQAQSNVKLVGYTTQPLDQAVDAAIDGLLEQ